MNIFEFFIYCTEQIFKFVYQKEIMSDIGVMLSDVTVSCGQRHTAFINNGNLYTFGGNSNGELGTGDTEPRTTPYECRDGVLAVACGDGHTVVLLRNGTVMATGSNSYGQLATGDKKSSSSFVQVTPPYTVKKIVGGPNDTLLVCVNKMLFAYGKNTGISTDEIPHLRIADDVDDVACGDGYYLVRKGDHLYLVTCTKGNVNTRILPAFNGAVQVSCSGRKFVVLMSSGNVYSDVYDANGRWGYDYTSPSLIKLYEDTKVTQVVRGPSQIFVVQGGNLYVHNDEYWNTCVMDVYTVASAYHTVLVRMDGNNIQILAYGLNNLGQCGLGHRRNRVYEPCPIHY